MSERTPEEREAARREREARRTGSYGPDGRSAPEPDADRSPPPRDPPTVRWPPPAPADDPPTAQWPAPPPGDDPAAVPWPPSAPGPRATETTARGEPEAADSTPRSRFARPAGLRGPRGALGPEGGRPHRVRTRVLAVGALLVALVAIWFVIELFQPFYGSGSGTVVVTIPTGSSTGAIGDQLARAGVISSSFFFGLRAALEGDRGQLRAGTYRLRHGMSYGAVLSALTAGPPAAPTTNVTIIPGRTRRQIALLLHKEGVHGRFLTDTSHTTLLDLRAYGAPRNLDNLEGFLFPSTYQLRTPISIPALVADELTAFRQQFATVNMSYAASKNLTPYDVLKIASMVEAEAGTAHDRPLIASVIYNRLRLGMTLGIDATIRYAVGNYTTPLTASQLSSPSPYNTRTHAGLPPTPIDNPSLASIQAAAHPAHTSYLYFVAKPCGNGASAFASTSGQFQLEVTRYNDARAQRGGRSPLKC